MTASASRSRRAAVSERAAAAPEPEAAATPFGNASPETRQLAASVLEVLAGSQTPLEVARGLGLSLARYYQLERRALAGLVAACESRRGGRHSGKDWPSCAGSVTGCGASAPASRRCPGSRYRDAAG